MATYIGTVLFDFPLVWANIAEPVILGADVRTRSGAVASVRAASPSQANRMVKLFFSWVPYSDVEALKDMWRSGAVYPAKIEDTVATIYNIRFLVQDGVTNITHAGDGVEKEAPKDILAGTSTDLWNGELNLVIV